jgi:hypothetical protein
VNCFAAMPPDFPFANNPEGISKGGLELGVNSESRCARYYLSRIPFEAAVDPRKEPGFVTHVTFFEHFRCPLERLEGTAETEETAETCS